MPVVKLNSDSNVPARLWHQAQTTRSDEPIIGMIHGYRYSPSHPDHDPHRNILSTASKNNKCEMFSWPRALGFGTGRPNEGIAFAYGWEARGSIGRAYHRAGEAGEKLGHIASQLSERTGRPIALIGHSLGARVALQALHHASAGSIGRIVLLTGAEFRDVAEKAINSPAGQQAEIINITSRENDLFDFVMELWLGRGRRQALGFGLEEPARNWIDAQIDHSDTLDALDALGFPVERGSLRMSHWTPYLRRGLFDFYRTALCQPWALPMPMLRARLPERVEPRWSRLFAPPAQFGGLRA